MRSPVRPPRTLAVAGVVLILAAASAGCLGGDDAAPSGPTSSSPREPMDAPGAAEGGSGSSDPSPATANRSAFPAPMIWTDIGGGFYRVGETGGNVTPLGWGSDVGLMSMRWGPDGRLYGSTPAGAVHRVDPANGTVERLFESPVMQNPIAMTVLEDGRFAFLDVGGGVTSPEGSARVGSTRVVLLGPGGDLANVWGDPRFSGTVPRLNWGDIATGPEGRLYVVTGNSDHNRTTPDDPSDDNGTGAVWRIGPAGAAPPELLASHGRFAFPDGIDVAADGSVYVVEWVADAPEVYRIADGTTEVVATLEGANRLWLPEVLPDGRVAVIGAGGPVGGPDDPDSPGGLWVVDPTAGSAEHVATIPEVEGGFGPVRVWR